MIINQFRSFKLISRQLLLNVKLHCWFFKSHFKTKEADLNRIGDLYITWYCRIICFGQRSATKALDKMSLPELLIVEMKTLSKSEASNTNLFYFCFLTAIYVQQENYWRRYGMCRRKTYTISCFIASHPYSDVKPRYEVLLRRQNMIGWVFNQIICCHFKYAIIAQLSYEKGVAIG